MTTFTLQDLTPAQLITDHLNAPEVPRETKDALKEIINTRSINNLPTTPEEDEAMQALSEKQFVEYGMNNPISASAIEHATQHATTPQPTLEAVINNICTQLQLLTSVISQSQAETKAGENSLQETVALVLQQSDWFKDMLHESIDAIFDIEDYAKDAVQGVVESEVESYFSNSFDPTDHFDFNDAVQDAVSDQIDDIVSDKIDDAVDSYLSGATLSISK